MNTVSSAQAAWLAGIFEGEGCLYLAEHTRAGYARCSLTVAMTDLDVIQRVHALTGIGGVREHSKNRASYSKNHWKPQYAWYVGRRDEIAAFLHAVYPWLGERRRSKADEFLAWRERAGPVPQRIGDICLHCGSQTAPRISRGKEARCCPECARRRARDLRQRKASARADARALTRTIH